MWGEFLRFEGAPGARALSWPGTTHVGPSDRNTSTTTSATLNHLFGLIIPPNPPNMYLETVRGAGVPCRAVPDHAHRCAPFRPVVNKVTRSQRGCRSTTTVASMGIGFHPTYEPTNEPVVPSFCPEFGLTTSQMRVLGLTQQPEIGTSIDPVSGTSCCMKLCGQPVTRPACTVAAPSF